MSNETMDQDELDRQLAAMAGGGEDAPDGADDDKLAAEWEAALAGDDSKPSAGADKAQTDDDRLAADWAAALAGGIAFAQGKIKKFLRPGYSNL